MLGDLPFWITPLFMVNRWVHIVATAVLVGGILFLEYVVPRATEDLKDDQRLAVFGKARFYFHRIVWICAILLTVTGGLALWRMWPDWLQDESLIRTNTHESLFWHAARPWFIAHILLGLIGLVLILRVTAGRKLFHRPVGWMQVIFMVLLVSIFLGAAARDVRMRIHEFHDAPGKPLPHEM